MSDYDKAIEIVIGIMIHADNTSVYNYVHKMDVVKKVLESLHAENATLRKEMRCVELWMNEYCKSETAYRQFIEHYLNKVAK